MDSLDSVFPVECGTWTETDVLYVIGSYVTNNHFAMISVIDKRSVQANVVGRTQEACGIAQIQMTTHTNALQKQCARYKISRYSPEERERETHAGRRTDRETERQIDNSDRTP